LLLDAATISSGSSLKDPLAAAKRLNRIISQSLGVDPLATADEETLTEAPPKGDEKEEPKFEEIKLEKVDKNDL
jgi:hypothetical protein